MLGSSYLGQTYVGQPVAGNDNVLDVAETINVSDRKTSFLTKNYFDISIISDAFIPLFVRAINFLENIDLSDSFSKVAIFVLNFINKLTFKEAFTKNISKIYFDLSHVKDKINFFSQYYFYEFIDVSDKLGKRFITSFKDSVAFLDHFSSLLIKGLKEFFYIHDLLRSYRVREYFERISSKDYIYIFKNGIEVTWQYIYKVIGNAWENVLAVKDTIWKYKYKK